ncbi:MAG: agmatine deiminase family protein [Gammaproteobacteria bacterium]|nr:agmatine deiminase family protein [Gammaproteobacteria bacterium]
MKRLPAEWERQSGIQLTWPHGHGDWAPWLDQVEPVFVDIARHVCERERLILVCYDQDHEAHIRQRLSQAGLGLDAASFYQVPSNDTWARDHGPISILEDGIPRLLDFRFNGWGGKFEAELDNGITRHLHEAGAFKDTQLQHIDMVLEGGGIESDGAGSLLTTSACQLSSGRNPDLDQVDIEQALRQALGVERILWLGHGHLEGDDTDSHIDTLARFADPGTIIYVACDVPTDPHYSSLKAMEAELGALRQANGEPYRLVALPWPAAIHDDEGQRLPASYANFLILNEAVLVPTYRDAADAEALEVIGKCFTDREVIGIDCLPLIWQYGSLHCVTMQYIDGIL